jgi:hypothetical protein
VAGARQLRAQLKAAGQDLGDLKAAHKAVGDIVAPVARSGAPVVSGRLGGSIRVAGTTTATIIRAGTKVVPYAGPIHYGWPARAIPARPFITDAAKRTEPQWAGAFTAAVNAILSKITGKGQ